MERSITWPRSYLEKTLWVCGRILIMWSVPGKFNMRWRTGVPADRRNLEMGNIEQEILRPVAERHQESLGTGPQTYGYRSRVGLQALIKADNTALVRQGYQACYQNRTQAVNKKTRIQTLKWGYMMEVLSKYSLNMTTSSWQLRNGSRVNEIFNHWSSSPKAPRAPPTRNRTGASHSWTNHALGNWEFRWGEREESGSQKGQHRFQKKVIREGTCREGWLLSSTCWWIFKICKCKQRWCVSHNRDERKEEGPTCQMKSWLEEQRVFELLTNGREKEVLQKQMHWFIVKQLWNDTSKTLEKRRGD